MQVFTVGVVSQDLPEYLHNFVIMTILKKNQFGLLMSFIMICFSAQVLAQSSQQTGTDFTDAELESFVEVVKVQQSGQLKMVEAIRSTGLDVNSFNQILQAKQNPDAEVSEADEKKFQAASQKVKVIQQGLQGEVMKEINDTGLGVNKYTEIAQAYQQDAALQQKVNTMLTDN